MTGPFEHFPAVVRVRTRTSALTRTIEARRNAGLVRVVHVVHVFCPNSLCEKLLAKIEPRKVRFAINQRCDFNSTRTTRTTRTKQGNLRLPVVHVEKFYLDHLDQTLPKLPNANMALGNASFILSITR